MNRCKYDKVWTSAGECVQNPLLVESYAKTIENTSEEIGLPPAYWAAIKPNVPADRAQSYNWAIKKCYKSFNFVELTWACRARYCSSSSEMFNIHRM